jgi:mono/diheme cytochrome c family protein
LHEGVGREGEQLYPAFPYAQYTRLSDADVLAIKAYLFSLPAVKRANAPNAMTFPFGFRPLVKAWNLLNFKPGRFTADPARGERYNRGQYLAEALGHCNECHTPRNLLQGLQGSRPLAGGTVNGWQAYNITPDAVSGIGQWSADDIVKYLSTGRLEGHAVAAGPMAEVVGFSTRFLSSEDLQALATYLKAQPAIRDSADTGSRNVFGRADADRLSFSAPADPDHPGGRGLYVAACASCHALAGTGSPAVPNQPGYPGLMGSSALGARSADNLVLTVLLGVRRPAADGPVFMPPFGADSTLSNELSDEQIATLANYLMPQFGNPQAARVTAAHVAALREVSRGQ